MAMTLPTIALPPDAASEPPAQLPELPPELLLTLLTKRQAATSTSPASSTPGASLERDALDSFVLSGAGASGTSTGGVQVEDVLNELLPDGQSLPSSPQVGRHSNSKADAGSAHALQKPA